MVVTDIAKAKFRQAREGQGQRRQPIIVQVQEVGKFGEFGAAPRAPSSGCCAQGEHTKSFQRTNLIGHVTQVILGEDERFRFGSIPSLEQTPVDVSINSNAM
jgi:hypothetical protein